MGRNPKYDLTNIYLTFLSCWHSNTTLSASALDVSHVWTCKRVKLMKANENDLMTRLMKVQLQFCNSITWLSNLWQENAKDCGGASSICASLFLFSSSLLTSWLLHSWMLWWCHQQNHPHRSTVPTVLRKKCCHELWIWVFFFRFRTGNKKSVFISLFLFLLFLFAICPGKLCENKFSFLIVTFFCHCLFNKPRSKYSLWF